MIFWTLALHYYIAGITHYITLLMAGYSIPSPYFHSNFHPNEIRNGNRNWEQDWCKVYLQHWRPCWHSHLFIHSIKFLPKIVWLQSLAWFVCVYTCIVVAARAVATCETLCFSNFTDISKILDAQQRQVAEMKQVRGDSSACLMCRAALLSKVT